MLFKSGHQTIFMRGIVGFINGLIYGLLLFSGLLFFFWRIPEFAREGLEFLFISFLVILPVSVIGGTILGIVAGRLEPRKRRTFIIVLTLFLTTPLLVLGILAGKFILSNPLKVRGSLLYSERYHFRLRAPKNFFWGRSTDVTSIYLCTKEGKKKVRAYYQTILAGKPSELSGQLGSILISQETVGSEQLLRRLAKNLEPLCGWEKEDTKVVEYKTQLTKIAGKPSLLTLVHLQHINSKGKVFGDEWQKKVYILHRRYLLSLQMESRVMWGGQVSVEGRGRSLEERRISENKSRFHRLDQTFNKMLEGLQLY